MNHLQVVEDKTLNPNPPVPGSTPYKRGVVTQVSGEEDLMVMAIGIALMVQLVLFIVTELQEVF